MISVCIATYNGGKYLKNQLESIIVQLGEDDEIIISDDSSTDNTLDVINSFRDKRIKVFPNQKYHSPIWNFENALKYAKGDYIFLSDQDDIWRADKVKIMLSYLSQYSLVLSNCSIIDTEGSVIQKKYWKSDKVQKGSVLKNIIHNSFSGCRMAFRKEVLNFALPFPAKIAMHDIWIGLCASAFFSAIIIPDTLVLYRRHGNNVSNTGENSTLPYLYRVSYRLYFIYHIIKRGLF